MRLFISVELTRAIKNNLAELSDELMPGLAEVKWVEPKNLHITLKFLGSMEDEHLGDLLDLTAEAVKAQGSFKVTFEGLGTFPTEKDPRIIWVGTTTGGPELTKLALELETALSQAGFRSEAREFQPHITVGRVKEKKGVDRLIKKIKSIKNAGFGEMIVDRVTIMKSTLRRSGPIYEIIKEVKL